MRLIALKERLLGERATDNSLRAYLCNFDKAIEPCSD
jgi:hypothetical protein